MALIYLWRAGLLAGLWVVLYPGVAHMTGDTVDGLQMVGMLGRRLGLLQVAMANGALPIGVAPFGGLAG